MWNLPRGRETFKISIFIDSCELWGFGGGGLLIIYSSNSAWYFHLGYSMLNFSFKNFMSQGSWRGKNKNDVKNHIWNAMLVHLGHFIFQFVSRLGLTCALSDQLKIHVNLQM